MLSLNACHLRALRRGQPLAGSTSGRFPTRCISPLSSIQMHIGINSTWIRSENPTHGRPSLWVAAAAVRRDDDIQPIPAATLPPLASMEEIEAEAAWLAVMIYCWLDEEWTPLEIHKELGDATARVYLSLRSPGCNDEVGDVILGLGQGLMAFNFRETFVGPFDVANKAAELLMLRAGFEVCCTSEDDRQAIQRYETILSSTDEDSSS